MYRPNRIGPNPLIHLDKPEVNLSAAAVNNRKVTSTAKSFIVPDATVRTETAQRSMRCLLTNLTVGQNVAYGCAINGENPSGELTVGGSVGFMLDVWGRIHVEAGAAVTDQFGLVPMPFIGRNPASTLQLVGTANNTPVDYHSLPGENTNMEFCQVASFKQTLVMGMYDGDDTYSGNPILVGFNIENTTTETQTYNVFITVGIHKYLQDLDTFDPSRF